MVIRPSSRPSSSTSGCSTTTHDFSRGRRLCEEALALARQARELALASPSPYAWQPLALATQMIGYHALQANRLDEAGRWFDEVIALERRHGDTWSIGILLTDLAGLRVLEGRLATRRARVRRTRCRACRRFAIGAATGSCLQTIAMLEAAEAAARSVPPGCTGGGGDARRASAPPARSS